MEEKPKGRILCLENEPLVFQCTSWKRIQFPNERKNKMKEMKVKKANVKWNEME